MKTSVTDYFQEYKKVCEQAVISEDVFNSFRSNGRYRRVVDHLDRQWGYSYIRMINNLLVADDICYEDFMAKFTFNDEVGRPCMFDYSPFGQWSPTTLRYIYTAFMLRKQFGELHNSTILEIGGGYGGQAAILMTQFNVKKYGIFDLNEVVGLISKYLNVHNFKQAVTYNQDQFIEMESIESDLVISDFAFSELSGISQDLYFEKVIRHSKRGYMTLNFFSDKYHIKPWGMELYKDKFAEATIDINIRPLINAANTGGKNCVITWDITNEDC